MDEIKKDETKSPVDTKEVSKAQAIKNKLVKCVCGNKKHIIVGIVLILILVGAGGYYYNLKKTDIGLEGAGNKVLEFVNGNLLQPGMEAELVDAVKESGLYKITIKVGEQEIPTYLTQDGKQFFPQAMETEVTDATVSEEEVVAVEIPKTDKPSVDLYVMSFCPFGNQAEDTLKPVYELLKNKVDFNFHYIVSTSGDVVSSLHGEKEVVQNEREACVLRDYGKDKWMDFVTYVNTNCGSDGVCWEAGAKNFGLSTAKISACVASEGVTLMKENETASNIAGAQGSPTMLVNGVATEVVYQYGNAENYKQAICGAFNESPAECDKILESTTVAAGGSCN